MYISTWKKEMASLVREQKISDKYDLITLYTSLQETARKYIRLKHMEEGSLFKMMLENGTTLEIQFFVQGSELIAYGTDGRQVLMDRSALRNNDMRGITAYQEKIKEQKIGIGSPYPGKLKEIVQNLSPGELIVFGNGKSYACINQDPAFCLVKPTFKATDLNTSSFLEVFASYKNTKLCPADWRSLQMFWNRICDNDNENLVARIQTLTKAQETINRCVGNLAFLQTKKLDFGVISFHVKRSRLDKKLKWYLDNGKSIEENTVKIIICWLDIAPVITEFKRADSNAVYDFNDNLIKEALNDLYKKKEYKTAYALLCQYCKENKGTLQVSLKSFVKGKGEQYHGKAIVFSQNGVFSLNYPDGDFTRDAASISQIGESEFVSFCEQKFNDAYIYIKNEKMAEIKEQYKSAPEPIIEKVAEVAAKRELEAAEPGLGIEIVEQDISSLIESFATVSEKEATKKNNPPRGRERDDEIGL